MKKHHDTGQYFLNINLFIMKILQGCISDRVLQKICMYIADETGAALVRISIFEKQENMISHDIYSDPALKNFPTSESPAFGDTIMTKICMNTNDLNHTNYLALLNENSLNDTEKNWLNINKIQYISGYQINTNGICSGAIACYFDEEISETESLGLRMTAEIISQAMVHSQLKDHSLANQEILDNIFSTTHFLLALFDKHLNFIKVNHAYAKAGRHDPEFFIGKNHFDLYPDKENEKLFFNVLETGIPYTVYAKPFEYADQPEKGVTYWDWTLYPIKNNQGKNDGLLFILKEITEKKRLEEIKKKNETLLNEMGSIVKIGGWEMNLRTGEIFLTGEIKKIFEISDDSEIKPEVHLSEDEKISPEIIKERVISQIEKNLRFYESHIQPVVREAYNNLIFKGQSFNHELPFRTGGGRHIWVNTIGKSDMENGEVIRIYGTIQDITEKKLKEEKLRQYEHIVSSSSDLMALLDAECRYLAVNQAYLHSFDTSAEKIIGKSAAEILGMEAYEKYVKPNSMKCLSGEIVNYKGFFHYPKTGRRFMNVTYYPYTGDDGKIKGFVVHSRDITEEKMLEEQLQHAQKMEALGTLAGGIAHDFNNILSSIIGYTELIMVEKKESGEQTHLEYLENIETSGYRAKDLVKQILLFSRKMDSVKKALPLKNLIEEVIRFIKPTLFTTIGIHTDLKCNPVILADFSQIHQVIVNLLVNASQAMPEGGTIQIELKNEFQIPEIMSDQLDKQKNYVRLRIEDNGIGISEENMKHIFDPFYTTKEPGVGTGLGLSVVFGIVKSHDAFINVQSTQGKGTVFDIFFPLAIQEIKHDKDPGCIKSNIANKRILLLDDEPMILELLAKILNMSSFEVRKFSSVNEAVDVFQKEPDHFDLIISDFGMKEMTGIQAALKFKSIRKDIPILIITGYLDNNLSENVSSGFINEIIMKPFDRNTIVTAISRILKQNNDDSGRAEN